MHFETSVSHGYDLHRFRASTATTIGSGRKGERAGDGRIGSDVRVGREGGGAGGCRPNGVTVRYDTLVGRGESIPLRKASDPAESGLGSEDGEEADDPVLV